MACAVWVTAVTASDPNQTKVYPTPVAVNIFGQGPGMILTDVSGQQVSVTLLAPQSVWGQLNQGNGIIKAVADITGLGQGTHTVPVHITISNISPVELVGVDPTTISVTLETLATRTLPLNLTIIGFPAVGFELGLPTQSSSYISVSGPQSLVQQVDKITATINASQAQVEIHQTVDIQAVDIDNNPISGLTLTPKQVTITLPVTQLGGYRNVAVKVVTKGQISNGYRITNISVFPPVVTVFSSDPTLVDSLPGYIETNPIDITSAHDDIDTQASLNLPDGVSVVGNQTVTVQVGIAAIESSITLKNMPVTVTNLGNDLGGEASPNTVDIILSGPLLVLDQLTADKVHLTVDMTGKAIGEYQVTPDVTIDIPSITVESILPGTVQVRIFAATPTPIVNTGTPGASGAAKTTSPSATPTKKAATPVPTP